MKTKLVVVLALASAPALAQPAPSPYGSSPFVLPYQPPPEVDHAHHGLTLEVSMGAGSTSADASAGAGSIGIGGWITHDVSLSVRYAQTGSFIFGGLSVQYYATPSLWLGGGVGALSERMPDAYGGTDKIDGTGGFARLGYNVWQSRIHALYLSAEGQTGNLDGATKAVALFAVGYQML